MLTEESQAGLRLVDSRARITAAQLPEHDHVSHRGADEIFGGALLGRQLWRDGVVDALDVLQLDARNDFRRNAFAPALRASSQRARVSVSRVFNGPMSAGTLRARLL